MILVRKNAPAVVPAVPLINSEGYETADQIALRLHVQRSTIYDWAARKVNPLPSKRVTNKITLFVWSEVKAWVEAGGTLRRRKVA
jgi:predicted DNA-binding transcriptional regulator AlpA